MTDSLRSADVPTALLSVYDKSGIADLAEALHDLGWRIVSSGGTAKVVAERGVPVTDVADLTGVPAILDHRVVTLHPKVHGGLLADPTNPAHRADMAEYGIEPISLVVVNLYPFTSNPGIELIDIGGPAMVRASAKNHAHVAVVVDPDDYDAVLGEIARARRDHARDAPPAGPRRVRPHRHLRRRDRDVVRRRPSRSPSRCRATMHLALERAEILRYGENPHQQGARYRLAGAHGWWDSMVQHGGKALSYLNLYDTEAAWRLVNDFEAPACVIVKHANPCGVAVGRRHRRRVRAGQRLRPGQRVRRHRRRQPAASRSRWPRRSATCSPRSSWPPGTTTTRSPSLLAKKNLRVHHRERAGRLALRPEADRRRVHRAAARPGRRSTATRGASSPKASPTEAQWDDLVFAWQVCAAVSSNAIVYAKDRQAFGIGAGQQNRLDSSRIAAERSAGRAVGGVCASDAFFPFRDGLDAAAAAGITAVIQPGGSVRDDEVIAAADEHGIAMVFTDERHFRH